MHRPYRFLNTGIQDAALNMAIDESVLTHHLIDQVPPTLRVFRWSQPAISLGRFQNIGKEILSDVCQQRGVALVRRPTGGRAVYHLDEVTYSLVIAKDYGVPTGVVAAYAYLAQGLQAALAILGVHSQLSEEHVNKNPSAACFASSTQADLTTNGCKLIGSAQVWKEDALLQQGSLPLDDHAAEFFALLRYPSEARRVEALSLYNTKTAPLHTFAPKATWDDVANAFHKGFTTALGEDFIPGVLTPSEWDLAHQLAETKYSQLEWRQERINLV